MGKLIPLQRRGEHRQAFTVLDDLREAIRAAEEAGHDIRRISPHLERLWQDREESELVEAGLYGLVDVLLFLAYGHGFTDDEPCV